MIIKEGFRYTKGSITAECTKSYQIIIHNFVKETESPVRIERLDKNDSSYDGHSKIMEIYFPMLKDYNLENENLLKEEKLIISILKEEKDKLLELAQDDEDLEKLVKTLTEAKKISNEENGSICIYLNYFDKI